MKIFLYSILFLPIALPAQMIVSDITNSGGSVSDFSNAETVVTASSGIGYRSLNNAVFNHYGPATGTLTVNGSYDAYSLSTANPGVDNFTGLNNAGSAVEIAGNTSPLFGILNLANGSGNTTAITNAAGIRVGSALNFSNGITTTLRSNTTTGAIHMLKGATYTGGNTDVQHVNGYVSKMGNQGFVFPVGSGVDIRTIQMSAPLSATHEYAVAWISGNPTSTGDPSDGGAFHPVSSKAIDISNVSTVGQWDWIAVSGSGAGLTITASIPDMTAFAPAADLRLAGWNGTMWINLSTGTGSSSASGNTENSTLTGVMQASITALAVANVTVTLPVTLTSFTVSAQQCHTITIDWKVADALNFHHFELQHSADGTSYVVTNMQLYSSTKSAYQYNDEYASEGLNYYRLKMVDLDGTIKYSVVETIKPNCVQSAITVFPNPVNDQLFLKGLKGDEVIQLYDTHGKLLLTQKAINQREVIALKGYAAAMYFVMVLNKNGQPALITKISKLK